MEGLTAGLFVETMAHARLVDCWITPFIRISNALPRRSRLRAKILPFLNTGMPTVVQLMGTHAEMIAQCAALCVDIGAAAIDLNCACPSKAVVSSRSGGALLRDPQWIHDALRGIRQACPDVGLGVKLRSGFTDPAELQEILPAVVAAGPDFAVLHFRTVAEMYNPVPGRLKRLATARQLTKGIHLFASGDIFTVDDALSVWRDTGVDGVTVARGLLRNPWLIRDIAGVCRCGDAPVRDDCDRLAFIGELAERAHRRGALKTGWILEIARTAFGDGKLFRRLVAHAATPAQLADDVRQMLSVRT